MAVALNFIFLCLSYLCRNQSQENQYCFPVINLALPLMAAERRTSNMSMSNYENNGKLISREVLVNFVAQNAFAYIVHDGE